MTRTLSDPRTRRARQGSPYNADIYEPEVQVPDEPEFTIDAHIDSVRLGSCAWIVTLGVGEANMFKRDIVRYFTIDSAWYHYFAARLEIQILSVSHLDAAGCFVVHPATLRVTGRVRQATQV